MLPSTNLSQTDQTTATLDRSMLIAAYRYQVQTLHDRIASLPESRHPHFRCVLDALDEAEDYLSLFIHDSVSDRAA